MWTCMHVCACVCTRVRVYVGAHCHSVYVAARGRRPKPLLCSQGYLTSQLPGIPLALPFISCRSAEIIVITATTIQVSSVSDLSKCFALWATSPAPQNLFIRSDGSTNRPIVSSASSGMLLTIAEVDFKISNTQEDNTLNFTQVSLWLPRLRTKRGLSRLLEEAGFLSALSSPKPPYPCIFLWNSGQYVRVGLSSRGMR